MSVILSGEGPQDVKLVGTTERLTLAVAIFAWSVTPVALGLHVNKSVLLPCPVAAAKVIVTGLADHVALGVVLVAKPTEA